LEFGSGLLFWATLYITANCTENECAGSEFYVRRKMALRLRRRVTFAVV